MSEPQFENKVNLRGTVRKKSEEKSSKGNSFLSFEIATGNNESYDIHLIKAFSYAMDKLAPADVGDIVDVVCKLSSKLDTVNGSNGQFTSCKYTLFVNEVKEIVKSTGNSGSKTQSPNDEVPF